MNSKAAKLLVVESDDALREQIITLLRDAEYAVSTDYPQGMKAILSFDADAVVLGADPSRLDCCDLLSKIKGSEQTHNIRVVMLSPGGSAERTRGLDLGADDVLSLPFDSHELLARVRSQLRNKSIVDEGVTAVNQERRTLRLGALTAIAVLVAAALVFFLCTATNDQILGSTLPSLDCKAAC